MVQCVECKREIQPGYVFDCADCCKGPLCGPCFFAHQEEPCGVPGWQSDGLQAGGYSFPVTRIDLQYPELDGGLNA